MKRDFASKSAKKSGNKAKAASSKKRKAKRAKWEWEPQHFETVLQDIGSDLGSDVDEKMGSIIFIKPTFRRGRPMMLTQGVGYWKANSSSLHRHIKEILNNEKNWHEWDIFGSEYDDL